MSELEKQLGTWEEVMLDFFRSKCEAEEENYLKDIIKSVEKIYERENFFNDEEIELVFNSRRNKKENDESSLDFQHRRAITLLKAKVKPEGLGIFKQLRLYKKEIASFKDKYDPINWLSKNCTNSSSVKFATHVIKLTHSSIDASSFYDSIPEQKNIAITTSALKNKIVDGAVKGNQFAPIFQFLELELNGVTLVEQLAIDDHLFDCFIADEKDRAAASTWISGFRGALDTGKLSSHALAKQIYFPTKHNQKLVEQSYHILCNVISSSMAQTIHERVYNEREKSAKKSLEKNKYSSEISLKYINRSQLGVTASNHSNASQLNAKRGGKLHLFSNRPPAWQSQIKPPLLKKSLFSDLYNSTIHVEVSYLRDFLIRFKKLDLSIKDPKRKQHLERWVNNIMDELLFYVGTIQNLPSGWSSNTETKLKKSHQYLLDPYRLDEAFQTKRQVENWQAVVCADFARWLNNQLRGKDKQFTPQAEHSRLWKKMLELPLREYMEPVEQQIQQKMKEVV
ncbi:MAG: type I-F CRISPR-associated protein Csy1 [Nitrosomonas sp.]|nr:type I-F CRISPR-associated protein Csy1 [Nitrosomonas sp.]